MRVDGLRFDRPDQLDYPALRQAVRILFPCVAHKQKARRMAKSQRRSWFVGLTCSLLPRTSIILLMSEDRANEYKVSIKVNRSNKSVLVAANVKDNKITNQISGWKYTTQLGKVCKLSQLGFFVPMCQGIIGIGMFFGELVDPLA